MCHGPRCAGKPDGFSQEDLFPATASLCNVPTPGKIKTIPFAFFDSTRLCRYLFLVPRNEKLPPLLTLH